MKLTSRPATSPPPQTLRMARLGQTTAILGFVLYSVFAPHSIAAAEISLAIVGAGWLIRWIFSGTSGLRRTQFDIPILLFFFWTVLSSFLSEEPRISIAKIQSTCVVLLFYLTHSIVTRRTAVVLVSIMVLSGVSGTIYSVYDLFRGRGVLIESVAPNSIMRSINIQEGDAIWRVGGQRVYSVVDVDQIIRNTANGTNLKVSLISQGEHIERPGLIVSEAIKQQPSPSRIAGSGPTHRFRASGWTRHYETYAEIIQILAQLAFGLALANFKNHGLNLRAKLALAATALLALGITLTAMRTTMIALAIGLCVIGWRSLGRRTGLIAVAAVFSFLVMGAVVVYQTRAQRALFLQDPSSNLRLQVAKVGLSRMLIHPVFGHGMDSMHTHWTAWGFPGSDMLHLHSTPLQLAFDRGLPALGLWLWIMGLFWRAASRGERSSRESGDTNQHGLLLGSTGAVTGFFMSSLVNYNFGDGEVALVFWWLLGIVVVMTIDVSSRQNNHRRHSTLL